MGIKFIYVKKMVNLNMLNKQVVYEITKRDEK